MATSNWHSIRPWSPSLSLAVREITSVSATFILTSTLSDPLDPALLAALGPVLDHSADGSSTSGSNPSIRESESCASHSAADSPREGNARRSRSVIPDALAKGLSVNVNGSAWPRAFIRIDEQLDEAVIIIYALMPGRQYDIELGLAAAGPQSGVLRSQVTTEGTDDSDNDNSDGRTDPESQSLDHSDPSSTPSTSPSRTVPGTPPSTTNPTTSTTTTTTNSPSTLSSPSSHPQPAHPTLEDHIAQLRHTLALAQTERDTLLASLKSARKDSQKADAALRSEMDTLKRTSERNAAAEVRGRQKILALQEAVKRAQNATRATEEEARELEEGRPALEELKRGREGEYSQVKDEAERVRREREGVEEGEKRRLDAMRSELASLTHRYEKLTGKREKLESVVIPDFEERLKGVEQEIEAEEIRIGKMELEESMRRAAALGGYVEGQIPIQRVRVQSGETPGVIARPVPTPIQRPGSDQPSPSSTSPSQHSPQNDPGWSNGSAYSPTTHNQRSQSFHMAGYGAGSSGAAVGNTRRASLIASVVPPAAATIPASPTRPNANGMGVTSTLSSRAPPFEPSRSGAKLGGGSANVSPIQRPSGGASRSNSLKSTGSGGLGSGRW